MYPQRELTRLAGHKTALQRQIVLRRTQCATDAAQALRPLKWWNGVLAGWRWIAPVAALPLSFLAGRIIFRRLPWLNTAMRWAPLILGVGRKIRAFVSPPGAPGVFERS